MTAVVATRLVRPLRALTEAAQQPPELHVRVPVRTRDETGILAEAFNDLTERRERMEAQRKAMVSDIAHELRSPLTNIRGWLEVTRDGFVEPDPALLGSLHEEAMVLQRVIDDLQDLAAADAGTLRLHREPVPVEDLVDQVVAAYRVSADTAGVALTGKTDNSLWLEADPVRMRQVLGNLVSNALRHTPADGTVTLTAWREADTIVLTVTDTGSGIAPRTSRTSSNASGAPISPAAAVPEAAAWACPSSATWSPPTTARWRRRASPAPVPCSPCGCPTPVRRTGIDAWLTPTHIIEAARELTRVTAPAAPTATRTPSTGRGTARPETPQAPARPPRSTPPWPATPGRSPG